MSCRSHGRREQPRRHRCQRPGRAGQRSRARWPSARSCASARTGCSLKSSTSTGRSPRSRSTRRPAGCASVIQSTSPVRLSWPGSGPGCWGACSMVCSDRSTRSLRPAPGCCGQVPWLRQARPAKRIRESAGATATLGDARWAFEATAAPGSTMGPGDILGEVREGWPAPRGIRPAERRAWSPAGAGFRLVPR